MVAKGIRLIASLAVYRWPTALHGTVHDLFLEVLLKGIHLDKISYNNMTYKNK